MFDKLKASIKDVMKKAPDSSAAKEELELQLDEVRKELLRYQLGWPPGHFYSPIPSLDQVRENENRIWKENPDFPGIDLNRESQLKLLHSLAGYYPSQPWDDEKKEGVRFFFDNPNFSYGEAIILYSMLRHFQPKKVIEIGSGYSSCALLDTNEKHFANSIQTTFIEPFPQLLESLITDDDRNRITILGDMLQDVPLQTFSSLSAGDFLVIDSTHVSKIDSDVNHIFFNILPSINSGVYIHFHDIYYPFEYPKEWIYQGRAWNELYILRAFLQYNPAFEIVFFNSMLGTLEKESLEKVMPLVAKNPGSSFWLKKK